MSAPEPHLYNSPVVDLTTILGAQSGFAEGPVDPWFKHCYEEFVDMLIYADKPRYIVPIRGANRDPSTIPIPQFLRDVNTFSDLRCTPLPFYADHPTFLEGEGLEEAVRLFVDEVVPHGRINSVSDWVAFQSTIAKEHIARIGGQRLLYPFQELTSPRISPLYARLIEGGLSVEQIAYSLDVALRFPFYAELAEAERYLSHPIRDAYLIGVRTLSEQYTLPPLRFGKWFYKKHKMLRKWPASERLRLIVKSKEAVQKFGLNARAHGRMTVEEIRDICVAADLPPDFSALARTGSVSAISAATFLATELATAGDIVAGMAVAAVTAVSMEKWRSQFQSAANDFRLLRWARRWPEMEEQARP